MTEAASAEVSDLHEACCALQLKADIDSDSARACFCVSDLNIDPADSELAQVLQLLYPHRGVHAELTRRARQRNANACTRGARRALAFLAYRLVYYTRLKRWRQRAAALAGHRCGSDCKPISKYIHAHALSKTPALEAPNSTRTS